MAGPPRAAPEGNWWQRRVAGPIRQQLTQGISPNKIAFTLALGLILGVFPILGSGFLLCGLAAWSLRLNQPLIQAVGAAAYPLQVALLLPFYRAGEALFGVPPIALSIPELLARFFADVPRFLEDYGMTGARGIAVWALAAPWGLAGLYYGLRGVIRRVAARVLP